VITLLQFEERIAEYNPTLTELLQHIQPISNLKRNAVPTNGGIYAIFDPVMSSDPVYVGKTDSLQRRLWDCHICGSQSVSNLRSRWLTTDRFSTELEINCYLKSACSVSWVVVEDGSTRGLHECAAIAVFRPIYNALE
jgi:excinuclease UvrABC nuclease subunit